MKNNTTGLQAEKRLEEMLNDCSIDAIIAIDADKNICAWNATAERIHGKTKAEVFGKPVTEVIPSMQQDEETLKALKLAQKGIKSFLPSSKTYCHRFHAENHFIPLKDENSIKGVMILVHDVAHRIKAEEQLQHLNEELERRYRQLKVTSEELASFTYITSNKIKEPIRQIYTGVEHLIKVEANRLSDSGKATLRRMQSSLSRMDLLLDDILSIAQISILEKPNTAVDLTELVKEVQLEIEKRTETNLSITVNDLCVIKGHRNYLYMLFYNLLNNAVKFNESGEPSVKISCKTVVLHNEKSIDENDEYYQVTITDNGIGFEEADKEKIFAAFEKLHPGKYKGSGIGLTIARKIMEAHDGFITAKSLPGKGASFHCFFPVKESE